MVIVEQTLNMPQTTMYKGFEACYVNRLSVFTEIHVMFHVTSMLGLEIRPNIAQPLSTKAFQPIMLGC